MPLAACAMLAVTACSSLEPLLPSSDSRERAYKARLAEVAFPTSRARVFAAFHPAGRSRLYADPAPGPPGRQSRFLEAYPLDNHFELCLELATPPDIAGPRHPVRTAPPEQVLGELSRPDLKALRAKHAAQLASPTFPVLSATLRDRLITFD